MSNLRNAKGNLANSHVLYTIDLSATPGTKQYLERRAAEKKAKEKERLENARRRNAERRRRNGLRRNFGGDAQVLIELYAKLPKSAAKAAK